MRRAGRCRSQVVENGRPMRRPFCVWGRTTPIRPRPRRGSQGNAGPPQVALIPTGASPVLGALTDCSRPARSGGGAGPGRVEGGQPAPPGDQDLAAEGPVLVCQMKRASSPGWRPPALPAGFRFRYAAKDLPPVVSGRWHLLATSRRYFTTSMMSWVGSTLQALAEDVRLCTAS